MSEIELAGEKLILLSEKAVLWPGKRILVISDIHLGKAGHFRKHGIPISRKIHLDDLRILAGLIDQHGPNEVILLGDLFHSDENNEWNDFMNFLEAYNFVQFVLVLGNHDILNEYPSSLVLARSLDIPPFNFTHEREHSKLYNLSGHIHPGYGIRGIARQQLTVPCFCFSENYGILPAFGQFTGIKKIRKKKGDRIFGIAGREIVELI